MTDYKDLFLLHPFLPSQEVLPVTTLKIQSLRGAANSDFNEIMLSSNNFRFIRSSILIVFLSSAGGQTLDPPDPTSHPTTAAVVCLLQYCNQLDLDQQNQHQHRRNIFIINFTMKCYWLTITNLTLFTKTNNKRVKMEMCRADFYLRGKGVNMFS